jgi:zinc transport system substrate-binding protein
VPDRFTHALRGLAVLLAACSLAACHRSAPAQPAVRPPGPLRMVVSIPPLTGFTADLAPPGAQVTTLIGSGRSEHGYELTPMDRAALVRADLIVYIGLNLEPSIERSAREHPGRPPSICFAEAVGEDKAVPSEGEHPPEPTPAHHDDDDHDHGLIDPHLWLDPALVTAFLPKLSAAVSQAAIAAGAQPAAEDDRAKAALDAALARVADVDAAYRRELAPFAGRTIVTHHSAWARLANRYGLKIAAVIRPIEGTETTPAQLHDAITAIREQHATAVFVEPQFDPTAARRIAEGAGANLGTLDPLGTGDWSALMRQNLDQLVKTLSAPPR